MKTPPSKKLHSTTTSNAGSPSRRDVLGATTASVLGFAGGTMAPWFSAIKAAQAAEGKGPVAVVGASGRTGSLCVNAVSGLEFIKALESQKV